MLAARSDTRSRYAGSRGSHLSVRQKLLYSPGCRVVHHDHAIELPLDSGSFLAAKVALAAFRAHDLAGSGDFEATFCAFMRLEFSLLAHVPALHVHCRPNALALAP